MVLENEPFAFALGVGADQVSSDDQGVKRG